MTKCKGILKNGEKCGKRASFNVQGEPARFCKNCANDNMVNVVSKMCECGKARPSFNIPGKKATHCVDCKRDNMVDVKNKLCECGKARPSFNIPG